MRFLGTKPDLYRTAYPHYEYYVFSLVNLTDFRSVLLSFGPARENMIMPVKRRSYSGAKYTIIDAQIIRIYTCAVNRNCAISLYRKSGILKTSLQWTTLAPTRLANDARASSAARSGKSKGEASPPCSTPPH